MDELIRRQALLNKFEPWLKVNDYSDGELNMLKAILYEIRFMPSATDKNVGAKVGTNLAEVGTGVPDINVGELISRQQAIDALDEYFGRIAKLKRRGLNKGEKAISLDVVGAIKTLPPIQPDKDKVSDLLYRIYSIESPHLDMNGVIAKKYYCEELWKELFGKESELPRWMT